MVASNGGTMLALIVAPAQLPSAHSFGSTQLEERTAESEVVAVRCARVVRRDVPVQPVRHRAARRVAGRGGVP